MHLDRFIFWRPWLIFGGLALIIMGPLLLPGYILTLDLSWGPRLPEVDWASNTAPLMLLIHALGVVVPSWLVEKVLLVGIFMLGGVGMWRLSALRGSGWLAYLSGLMYVLNPFTYERLMAGQWLVLLGYSLLPWVAAACVRLLEKPELRRAIELSLWSVALGVASLHLVPMAGLLLAAILVANGWPSVRAAISWLVLAAGLWLMAAAFWLVPLVLRHSEAALSVSGFSPAQFEAFRTAGAPGSVLLLQGLWAERGGLITPPSSTGVWFGLASVLVLGSVAAGMYLAIRHRDRLALALAAGAAVAFIQACGVGWAFTADFTRWLVAHVPLYQGFREPAKWEALIALAYAYLAAFPLRVLAARVHGFWKGGAIAACALVPLAWSPLMLWGAAGQLRAASYPSGWRALDDRLNHLPATSPGRTDVLVLPWHQYLSLDFAGRVAANPAPHFFKRSVVVSDDPELLGVTASPSTKLATSIQNNVINPRFFEHNAGSALERLGVHYVVLLKVSDWKSYGWLASQSDLRLVADDPDWQLYQTVVRP